MARRPKALALAGALILSGPAVASLAHAQDFENVRIETVEVTKGVHMLMGRGGNIGVSSGADGVFLVDDQFAPLTDKIRAAIREFSSGPVRFVINTHWHADHTGGNENLGAAGVLIVAHDNVRKRMSVDQFMKAFDVTVDAAPEKALPVVTFSRDVTFHLNEEEIHAFHVENAHTDGDAIIHFRTGNAIHMGDTYFNGMYPFIDVQSGGSIDGMIKAAENVLVIVDANTKIIPGHGPLSNREELQAYRDMLIGVRDAVKREIGQGKTEEQVIAAKPTASFDGKWGGGVMAPERFTGILYSDLSRKK